MTLKDYDYEELERMGVDVKKVKEMDIKRLQGGWLW